MARIESWTHPRRLAHTDRPDPQSGLDAKFSVQYCLARALLDGRIVLEHFEGEAFRDPAARALMRRIHAAPFPETSEGGGEPLGAELRITFDDGGTIAKRVERALGRGTDNPLPEEALHRKFANCAGRALAGGPGRAAAAGAVAARRGRQPARSRRGDGAVCQSLTGECRSERQQRPSAAPWPLLYGAPIAAAQTPLPCAKFTSEALPRPTPRVAAWPVKRFEAINAQVRNTPHRVLFLGDSLTERFPHDAPHVWREHMQPRGVLNAGVSGDRTENLLWRLQNGNLAGPPPALVVMLIGTNDLAYDGPPRSPELAAEGIRANLLYLRRRLPDTPILLLGLLPRGAPPDSELRRKVAAVNGLISALRRSPDRVLCRYRRDPARCAGTADCRKYRRIGCISARSGYAQAGAAARFDDRQSHRPKLSCTGAPEFGGAVFRGEFPCPAPS